MNQPIPSPRTPWVSEKNLRPGTSGRSTAIFGSFDPKPSVAARSATSTEVLQTDSTGSEMLAEGEEMSARKELPWIDLKCRSLRDSSDSLAEKELLARILGRGIPQDYNYRISPELAKLSTFDKYRQFGSLVDFADSCIEIPKEALKLTLFPIYMFVFLDIIRCNDLACALNLKQRYGKRFDSDTFVFKGVSAALDRVKRIGDAEKCVTITHFVSTTRITLSEKCWTSFRVFLDYNKYIFSIIVENIDLHIISPENIPHEASYNEHQLRALQEAAELEQDRNIWRYYCECHVDDGTEPDAEMTSDSDSNTSNNALARSSSNTGAVAAYVTNGKQRKTQKFSGTPLPEVISNCCQEIGEKLPPANGEPSFQKPRSRHFSRSSLDEGNDVNFYRRLFGEYDEKCDDLDALKRNDPDIEPILVSLQGDLTLTNERIEQLPTIHHMILHDLERVEGIVCVQVCEEFTAVGTGEGLIQLRSKAAARLKRSSEQREQKDTIGPTKPKSSPTCPTWPLPTADPHVIAGCSVISCEGFLCPHEGPGSGPKSDQDIIATRNSAHRSQASESHVEPKRLFGTEFPRVTVESAAVDKGRAEEVVSHREQLKHSTSYKNRRIALTLAEAGSGCKSTYERLSLDLEKNVNSSNLDWPELELRGHRGAICSMSYSHRGSVLLSGCSFGEILAWNVATGQQVSRYRSHTDSIWDMAMSPHDHYFASGSEDCTTQLWTLERKVPLRIFAGHWCGIQKVAFHPTGTYIASASLDWSVKLFEVLSGKEVRTLENSHYVAATSLDFSKNGHYLAVAGLDNYINVWDLRTQRCLLRYEGTAPIRSAYFSADNKGIISVQLDGVVNCYKFSAQNRDTKPQYSSSLTEGNTLKALSFSKDHHSHQFRVVRSKLRELPDSFCDTDFQSRQES